MVRSLVVAAEESVNVYRRLVPPSSAIKLVKEDILTDGVLIYVKGTMKVQLPTLGVILAYSVCEPAGKVLEGLNELGLLNVPAEMLAAASL